MPKKKLKKLDEVLDKFIVKTFDDWNGDAKRYDWWWNGSDVIALVIASAARHVRRDGCHLLTEEEGDQLKDLEKLFLKHYETGDGFGPPGERARAFALFADWFERLWD